MRLVRRVENLETAASGAGAAPAVVPSKFVCWTPRDVRADASQLAPGELLAVDVELEWSGALGRRLIFTRERITRDESDLGLVYEGGASAEHVIGRLVAIDGDVLTWRYDAGGGESVDLPRRSDPGLQGKASDLL
jgi:hypothetical protein